ncbi:MAG: DEAD/DEAH box helicase [Planctomycetota bacterium]|nr:MAG: DEAD/DEAH box helicase [Planctomycetota bacterium]
MNTVSRDEIASEYLDLLPFEPYPVQEEALLAWFSSDEGVLVCAPTGTGKTLIAEAAVYEALRSGTRMYYTTPLIALTEQKFRDLQAKALEWGYDPDQVGLVTGNRRVNPEASVLVVVAEILLNRLLHSEAFDFGNVSSVVMDEFHSFNDPERGIVWELSLALLPKHVRLLLLSATVGNTAEFMIWLRNAHGRRLQLVQSTDRRVPLQYEWVGDRLLAEQIEWMAQGAEGQRYVPALVFCFNREQCWQVAEQVKGRRLLEETQRKTLLKELERHDWSTEAGPKLRTLLARGVGVHHAGVLPRYKRIVEHLFQQRLLPVTVCTETLSAGINLPARSVVLSTLLKGPKGKKKLISPSTAHQIFGRAGRPQYDDRGYVFAVAHEDDVKIARFKEKLDAIPEDTRDPQLIKARKALKKKMPTRRSTEQYWNEAQFQKLIASPPEKLASRGPLPWRLLAYWLLVSPDVDRLREILGKRLLEPKKRVQAERQLVHMLETLWAGGYVRLEPEPPQATADAEADESPSAEPGTLGRLLAEADLRIAGVPRSPADGPGIDASPAASASATEYVPHHAYPTEKLPAMLYFRSVNPLYALFLVELFGRADREERIQAMESVLDMPVAVARQLRVPRPDILPPGPLEREYLDPELLARGLATPAELTGQQEEDEPQWGPRERVWKLTLAEKLRRLFDAEFPRVDQLRTQPVWAVGELLRFGGNFNKLITSRRLAKQEGIVYRHMLRYILLTAEFAQVVPPGMDADAWRDELLEISATLVAAAHRVDPESTDELVVQAPIADVAEETVAPTAEFFGQVVERARSTRVVFTPESLAEQTEEDWGEGIFDDEDEGDAEDAESVDDDG